MSPLMEARLTAALRARAEQVQAEDLRLIDVPVAPLRGERHRHRRRTAVLAGLAVAAVAAAVAGPLVLTAQDGARSPQPAGPTEPGPITTTLGTATVDLDGDGALDDATIVRTDGRLALRVVLGSGDRVETPLSEGASGELLPAGDLGGGPGEELVVPVADSPAGLPEIHTWLDAEGLAVADYPESGLQGWQADSQLNRWTVDQGRFRTWEVEPVPGDERVPFWDWSVDGQARLRPGGMMLGCVTPGSGPVACEGPDRWGKDEPDMGSRGDLPILLPAVHEGYVGERYPYGADFYGPGSEDDARLQGDFTPVGEAEDGHVELVVTVEGVEHRAPVAAGWNPELVPRTLAVHGDTPVFVVERPLGDTAFTSVFSFVDGELAELEPQGDVFLGSGVVKFGGELTEQRTWVTVHGQLFTAVLVEGETRRHHLWQWDVGTTVTSKDLGEVCIDWESGAYGRCR